MPRSSAAPAPARITSVMADSKDVNVRRVKVGRRTVASVRAADVTALRLREGRLWTEELAQRVARRERAQAARSAALRALARSRGDVAGLRDALLAAGHDRAAVRAALAELRRDGWLAQP